jgi:hypothetical protein
MSQDFLLELLQYHRHGRAELELKLGRLIMNRVSAHFKTDEELDIERRLMECRTILNRLESVTRSKSGDTDAASWETTCRALLSPRAYEIARGYARILARQKRNLGLVDPQYDAESYSVPGLEPHVRAD